MTAFDSLPPRVTVYEVGPRDGLQNEPQPVPTQAKIQFINLLAEAGLPYIEATSFVRAGAIPQLADAEEVVAGVGNGGGARFTALVPNVRGMERASSVRLFGIALFTAASETFSRRNVNASIAETLGRFRPVVEVAKSQGLWIRGYVSTAFGCPFEGHVPPPAVVEVALELLELGVEEISVSDTIGVANPRQVQEVLDAVTREIAVDRLALHFHDTRGTALANVLAGLQAGVQVFDSSAGGLGGCPYAPGAAGNLATEDLIYMLDGMGIETGVSLSKVVAASKYLAEVRGRPPVSRYFQAAVA